MTTTAPTYADVPMGHYCAICDRDRTEADRFAGVIRGDDWICPECLAAEPSDEDLTGAT